MKLMPAKMHGWAGGAVIYQIYPRSFQDSNGDGVGDLKGITSRLDYLKDLGVTGIWLSPFYPSPMVDFGYDVADYCDVDPLFGTLKDFKLLLAEAEKRGIKIIVDIVPNHTSDEHPWFKESRRSKTNKYSDWYIWKEPAGYKSGKPLPPNNWIDIFTGRSAWEWEPKRKQFYMHHFHVRQPDLNWQNHAVRDAIHDVLRFWLGLGVDGFRVDAVPFMGKDPSFRDDPINPDYKEGQDHPWGAVIHKNSYYWPHMYAYLNGLAEVLKEKRFNSKPRFMITEGYLQGLDHPVKEYLRFYQSMDPAVSAPFIFEGISLPWEAGPWQDFLANFHAALAELSPLALSSYAFGNHDQPRLASRLGEKQARAAAVMKLTLPGMIFVYYGEDLGLKNVKVPPELLQDPGTDPSGNSRDPERTPMQWSAEKNAGFSTAKQPWLPLAPDYKKQNVEVESKDKTSFLTLYKELIALRKASPAISRGIISVENRDNPSLLVYGRIHGQERYTTAINFGEKPLNYSFSHPGHVVLSSLTTRPEHTIARPGITLKPYEAIVIKHHG